MPEIALGIWFYTLADVKADVNLPRLLIGSTCLLFIFWYTLCTYGTAVRALVQLPACIGILAGLDAGFTSFLSHTGDHPLDIYLLSEKQSKTQYQATTVFVFWIINVAKAIPYAFLG